MRAAYDGGADKKCSGKCAEIKKIGLQRRNVGFAEKVERNEEKHAGGWRNKVDGETVSRFAEKVIWERWRVGGSRRT